MCVCIGKKKKEKKERRKEKMIIITLPSVDISAERI
jgi:hypothetical protein